MENGGVKYCGSPAGLDATLLGDAAGSEAEHVARALQPLHTIGIATSSDPVASTSQPTISLAGTSSKPAEITTTSGAL